QREQRQEGGEITVRGDGGFARAQRRRGDIQGVCGKLLQCVARWYSGGVDRPPRGLEAGGLDDLRIDHAVEIAEELHRCVEVGLQRGGDLRWQLRQAGADLVELRQHAAAVDRDAHLIVAAEI